MRQLCLALPLALAGFAASFAQSAMPGPEEQLDRFAQTVIETGDAPGISLAAYDGARVFIATRGEVERGGAPVTPDTRFLSASLGKTFTAVIAAQLVIEGVLDLDAPVAPWLADSPGFARLDNADRITLRQLLNHSAGVPDYLESWRFHSARGGDGLLPEDLLEFVSGSEGEPGAHFSYSDTHFIIAGLVLEAASGETYADLVRTRIIEPLQLTQTESLIGQEFDGLAVGYRRGMFGSKASGTPGSLDNNLDYEWAGGGLVTTPADLARFYYALGTERFAAERALMTASPNVLNAEARIGYGLGIYLRLFAEDDFRLFHGGDFAGFRSAAVYDSRTGLAIILQGNQKDLEAPDLLLEFNAALVALMTPE